MCKGSPNSSASLLSSHFQRWDRYCFCNGYHLDNVLGEPKACHPNHHIHIFAKWLPIFIGVIGANSSSPLPFQIDLRWAHDLLLPIVQIFHLPFEQLSDKGAYRHQENILKNVHDLIFQYHFKIVFKLSLHSIEILCKPKLGCLDFYLFSHPMI